MVIVAIEQFMMEVFSSENGSEQLIHHDPCSRLLTEVNKVRYYTKGDF